MSERQNENMDERDSVKPRTDWLRPQVDRYVAGAAEAGGDTSTDGIDILS